VRGTFFSLERSASDRDIAIPAIGPFGNQGKAIQHQGFPQRLKAFFVLMVAPLSFAIGHAVIRTNNIPTVAIS
jgi:hypothetical protein